MKEHERLTKELKRKPRPDFFESTIDLGSMKQALWVLVAVEVVKGLLPYVLPLFAL